METLHRIKLFKPENPRLTRGHTSWVKCSKEHADRVVARHELEDLKWNYSVESAVQGDFRDRSIKTY